MSERSGERKVTMGEIEKRGRGGCSCCCYRERKFSESNGYKDNNKSQLKFSTCTVDNVEDKMRDCFIKNMWLKGPFSPLVVALAKKISLNNNEFYRVVEGFDFMPQG
ncbi:hypothetical protein TorRG33x02_023610 [Trema orientale]|uniref:Uncharacterized protein n=1 Tax=Trema orientale TaxID=63057 RepID=A0A2P5FUV9_TREOI|nr:hypothetical protein TorRG33x02_023610 [Trema orientale]